MGILFYDTVPYLSKLGSCLESQYTRWIFEYSYIIYYLYFNESTDQQDIEYPRIEDVVLILPLILKVTIFPLLLRILSINQLIGGIIKRSNLSYQNPTELNIKVIIQKDELKKNSRD